MMIIFVWISEQTSRDGGNKLFCEGDVWSKMMNGFVEDMKSVYRMIKRSRQGQDKRVDRKSVGICKECELWMDSEESGVMVKDSDSDDVKYEFEYFNNREAFYKMKVRYIGEVLLKEICDRG